MNTRILALPVLLLSISPLLAQDNPATVPAPAAAPAAAAAPQTTPTRSMTWQDLAADLELTPEQLIDLERIDREHSERAKQLNRENLQPEPKKARSIELRDRKQAEIKEAMTKSQYKKWQEIKQQQRNAHLQTREQAKPAHQE